MDRPSWRQGIVLALAVCLWLGAWFCGRVVGNMLAPGSWLYTALCGVAGWSVGLGLATLVIYVNEVLLGGD